MSSSDSHDDLVFSIAMKVLALPAAEREKEIESLCPDTRLKDRVRDRVLSEERMGDFLREPVVDRDKAEATASMHAPVSQPGVTFRSGDVISGRFRVRNFVGKGGMGEVYAAEDLELGGLVALKTINPDLIDSGDTAARFRREIQLARQVTHPNVCRVFDVGRTTVEGRERIYFTMEYLAGQSLSHYLKERARTRQGPPKTPEALRLIEQLAGGIEALHAKGIVHRDLKPGNVMLVEGPGGRPRLVLGDFGLAREDGEEAEQLTKSQAIVGTPAYMAPEQLLGGRASQASDIYAFGLVAFEIATGLRLGGGKSHNEVLSRLQGDFVLPDHAVLPEGWEQAIRSCLTRDAEVRPASAMAVAAKLRTGHVAVAPKSRRKAVALALAALVSIAGGLLAVKNRGARGLVAADSGSMRDLLVHYYKPGNLANAVAQLEKRVAEPKGAQSALAHYELGWAMNLQYSQTRRPEDLDRAKAECLKAVELDPEIAEPHTMLSGLYLQGGRTDLAEAEVREALRIDSRSPNAYNALGKLYISQGRTAEVEATMQKAIDLAPEDWRWRNSLGGFFRDSGKLDRARKEFEEGVRLAPDNGLGFDSLASVLLGQSRYKEAQRNYERAIQLSPKYSTYSGLGTALMLQGDFPHAVEAFLKARDLNPNSYMAWANLASAAAWSEGGKAKATEAYLRALELAETEKKRSPKDPALLARMGGYYAATGNAEKALPLMRQALALSPDSPGVVYQVGEAYEILHRRDEALKWIQRSMELGYSAEYIKLSPELAELRADSRFHVQEKR